jgi:hypothetical protein
MVSFDYPKHKQKNLKFAWQPFGTQGLLEAKWILIQQLDEGDWIKLMYI